MVELNFMLHMILNIVNFNVSFLFNASIFIFIYMLHKFIPFLFILFVFCFIGLFIYSRIWFDRTLLFGVCRGYAFPTCKQLVPATLEFLFSFFLYLSIIFIIFFICYIYLWLFVNVSFFNINIHRLLIYFSNLLFQIYIRHKVFPLILSKYYSISLFKAKFLLYCLYSFLFLFIILYIYLLVSFIFLCFYLIYNLMFYNYNLIASILVFFLMLH
jgi:hypothetical protein